MYLISSIVQEEIPLWKQILTDLPHDPAALFLYLVAGVSILLIWRGSRNRQ